MSRLFCALWRRRRWRGRRAAEAAPAADLSSGLSNEYFWFSPSVMWSQTESDDMAVSMTAAG